MKRPAAVRKSASQADGPVDKPSFDSAQCTEALRTFASRHKGFEELGCKVHCKSHAARAVKKSGTVTHLRCKLRDSDPPCGWAAILREDSGGTALLLQHPSKWREHNEASVSMGQRGFSSVEERHSLVERLASTATARPSTALRETRLAPGGVRGSGTQLSQVQTLKRGRMTSFVCKNVGQLSECISLRSREPASRTQGYFCYSETTSEAGRKPTVTVVATTRVLQERFAYGRNCCGAIDGGFKFNLLGFPLHVIGQTNPAGNFGLVGLGLTSSMQSDKIERMLRGFHDSSSRVTRAPCQKAYAMSDGEQAYRRGMASVFGSSPLMCFFFM
jgi:hypothetical protein